jgi:putative transposase
MVTAGVYHKEALLHTPERRDVVLAELCACALEFGWQLQAWAVMLNHYHFVAQTAQPSSLTRFLSKVHGNTARWLNREDQQPGRKVWFEFWDTQLTYESSWLARLKYVHTNPVHHGVTQVAEEYRWCSAAWFKNQAHTSLYATVDGFKTEHVSVRDDF